MKTVRFAVNVAAASIVAAFVLTSVPSNAARDINKSAAAIDVAPDASRGDFDTPAFSGYLKYRLTYRTDADQDLVIRVNPKIPLRLFCMNVADFTFALADANGATSRIVDATQVRAGGSPISGPLVPWRNGQCPYGPVSTALFALPIDELFPDLKPGEYRLKISFRPRDRAIPDTPLPPLAFRILEP